MSVQESSPPAEAPAPTKPGPKMSPADRHERRVYVEHLYVQGVPTTALCRRVAKRYGIGVRMVHKDIKRIRARWAREDSAYLDEFKKRQLKGMDECARRLYAKGDFAGSALVRARMGRLVGMGGPKVKIDARQLHVHGIDRGAYQRLVELGPSRDAALRLLEALAVDAEVVPTPAALPEPAANGKATGGEHAA